MTENCCGRSEREDGVDGGGLASQSFLLWPLSLLSMGSNRFCRSARSVPAVEGEQTYLLQTIASAPERFSAGSCDSKIPAMCTRWIMAEAPVVGFIFNPLEDEANDHTFLLRLSVFLFKAYCVADF